MKIKSQSLLFIPGIDKWDKWEKDTRGYGEAMRLPAS
jgi:hypothetical protein